MKHRHPPLFFVALMVLLAAVLIYIFITLNSSVPTAVVELPDPSHAVSGDLPGDERIQYAAVTPETVQAVIASMSRPDGYSRSVAVEDLWAGGSSVSEFSVQVSGASTKISSLSAMGMKYILTTDTGVWIWYDGSDDAFYSDRTAPHDGDAWLRVLTYEELLELEPGEITAAGYEEHGGVWCVYASYDSPNFGYHTTVWVSAADGLLSATEIYDGETLIYRMTAGPADTTVPDDSVFTPPMADNAPASAYRIVTANTMQ